MPRQDTPNAAGRDPWVDLGEGEGECWSIMNVLTSYASEADLWRISWLPIKSSKIGPECL